jgi:hypothetical protein
LREAGIAAALGRRGRARPAVLWNPAIAAALRECENWVNVTVQIDAKLPVLFLFASPREIFNGVTLSKSLLDLQAFLRFSAPRNGFEHFKEVQISLDFIGGQRSILTFRFSAGDTMMRDRIYASRGM